LLLYFGITQTEGRFQGLYKKDWASLTKYFDCFYTKTLKNVEISERGANLSGLTELPTTYEQLIINMADR